MQESELKYYERIGNWDFSQIKCKTENLTNWDFYEKIRENSDEKSLCLDLGTGGGEKVLKSYPDVGMVIATDFSEEMIKTAKENAKKYADKKVKFTKMNNLEMNFPKETFDLISARHTIINAKQIYDCLVPGGTIVISGEEFEHRTIVERDLFNKYVKRYKTEKGILLKRVLYGIVAKK